MTNSRIKNFGAREILRNMRVLFSKQLFPLFSANCVGILFNFRNQVIILYLLVFVLKGFSQPLMNEIMSSNITSIEDEYDVDQHNCPVADCNGWYEQMGESTHDGDYPDWIEIYNPGSTAVNLKDYGLSDDPTDLFKWTFPNVSIAPKEYLLVFASGKDRKEPHEVKTCMHTNFKIDRLGETIIFTDNTGKLCDQIDTGEVPIDFSLGRFPDGGSNWVIFPQPTPLKSNTTPPFPGFTDTVRFSQTEGFYNGSLGLVLSVNSSTAKIYYTLDGEDPSPRSRLYTSPINISRTTVVKARTFNNGVLSSKIVVQTYFINEKFTFPVFSISTPPDNLWDEESGIYVPGVNADEGNRVANYWQDWERPVHITFYEPNKTLGFSIDAGIKIFGWGSRSNALKSFSVMFRDKYGQDELRYPLFPDMEVSTFKAIILRAAGNDWQKTYFRDPLASSLVEDKNVDRQAFRPAIVFLNGEYWGIHHIQEKLNEDYLASHFGIGKDNVDIISRYWRRSYPVVIEGDDRQYLAMENILKNYELNDPQTYDCIQSQVDVDNLIDYCIAQIYSANYDWPGNNNKCWRPRTENGKWRWLLYDLDYTFNSNGNNDCKHNTLVHATQTNNPDWPNPPHTTLILRKMLKNEMFRNDFINRFADYLNTVFKYSAVNDQIDRMKEIFEPEITRHINRWSGYGSTLKSKNDWEQNINVLRTFASLRPQYLYEHISEYFNLDGTNSIEVDVAPPGSGKIKVNTILIDECPWSGNFFIGVPIQLTALPGAGYRFTCWSGLFSDDSVNQQVSVCLADVYSIKANFEKSEESFSVIINEINYSASNDFDPEDWVELYNSGSSSMDMSSWIFRDNDKSHQFTFPQNTNIPSDGYLVLCRDLSAFRKKYPSVKNAIGDFNFGLADDQEMVCLFDHSGNTIDSVAFTSLPPWPVQPDGTGLTLSLKAPYLDNVMAQNWGPSIGYGTPGAANKLSSDADEKQNNLPKEISLYQNYPNPFNAITQIPFAVSETAWVDISIFNMNGRMVATCESQTRKPGTYIATFDASRFASGLYFYRLTVGSVKITKKMMMLD